MDGKSLDIISEQLEKLKSLFPEIISEGKIDFEKLKLTLGEDLTITDERYVLNWAGKSDAFRAIQTPTTATLKPLSEPLMTADYPDGYDNKIKNQRNHLISEISGSDNLFIEGENLEVLKVLQKSYYNKIKMIYIDPPYNTGNDNFIYPDKFSETKEEYLKRIGEMDEEGYLTKEGLFRKNSKDSGRYHSNWLSMMYPRLFLARNLLKDDGVIFVSIDDNEVHNLRLLMNEIFGEENFVGIFVWRKKEGGGQTDEYFVTEHEFILVFQKSENFIWKDEIFMADESEFNKNDEKGKFKAIKLAKWGSGARKEDRPTMHFAIKAPDLKLFYPFAPDGNEGRWRVGKPRMEFLIQNDLVYWEKKNDQWIPYEKIYFEDNLNKRIKIRSILYNLARTGDGTNVLKEYFSVKDIFDNPKPPELIKSFLKNCSDEDDIILDFFAGSGTTAQAVLELNREDSGNRKFILVQLPEKTGEESEAYKAGYKTIAEICKERIRRVIKKIRTADTADDGDKNDKKGKQEELSLHGAVAAPFTGASTENADIKSAATGNIDLGFKVFRLEPSNFKIWRTDTIENEEDLKNQMEAFADPVKSLSTEENMAWEILLKSGYELTAKLETLTVKDVCMYSVADGEMMIALNTINEKAIEEIIKRKPKQFICLDKLFNGNDQIKTNTVLQMRDAGIGFEVI
ncbi:MAG: site-specific DNA-methyltransferase [Bacteroidota bacterium]|nr:site-specific DNA-methyltransferase [Bacteroidota bacterium]